jgi:NAD(P)-dependent dehydrogenase (short-subunit alcohol dehydrogenase family)
MSTVNKTGQKLSGKKVVILGGSSGIGLATAQAAAGEGADVLIVSGNGERLDAALKTLAAGEHRREVVDLSQEQNIRAFFETVGAFDHLVYTAGENLSLNFVDTVDLATARAFFELRYWSAFAAVKYGAPHLQPGGSISLTGGIAGARPGKGWSVAATICAAMEGFTRALAVELAPIRVNCVVPGVIRTNLWNGMPEADREQFYKTVGNTLPVGRVGEADEVAQAFLYMMNQGFGTGQTITVDGGTVLV